jgi:DNA-binding NarL/FixJ family response regulator
MKKTRIFIVDDHPTLRRGLSQLINSEDDLVVCGEAGNHRDAIQTIRKNPPDLILVDITLEDPSLTGLDLIRDIHTFVDLIPILVFSMHDEMLYAERALRAGAQGYLMKNATIETIMAAIRQVLSGGIYVSDRIHQTLLIKNMGIFRPIHKKNPEECLSSREFEVFRFIGFGLQPREIAKRLKLSVKTIETHRLSIRRKLNFTRACDLAFYAVKWVHSKETRSC